MKLYIDADVILDVLLKRKKFLSESSQILNLCETKKITGCTTTLAMFLCTKTSPGGRQMIWFAGTRLSEHPIHK